MGKALVAFASRSGETEGIANLIAEGLRFEGADADVVDVKKIKNASDLESYEAYAFGSATYHGEMMQAMKTMLFMAEKAGLEGKVGASFGAFGWSGEAPDRIYETMKRVFKMDMVRNPLRLKSALIQGAVTMAQDYGREVAKKMR